MEGGSRFEGHRGIETTVEFGELRAGFASIVKTGTKDELVELLSKYPQRNSSGKLIWLLTSGMAVELTTGYERQHHDLDVVVMEPNNVWEWELLGTDNVTPGQYWADMEFNPEYLEKSALSVVFEHLGRHTVEVVHPTILMVQKLSNAFRRKPRSKDVQDAKSVAKWWEGLQDGNATWINIVNESIAVLPRGQRKETESRISDVVKGLFPR